VTVHGQTVGANLASIMDGLGPVDVELGSVVSLGFNQNGERDIVSYIEHVRLASLYRTISQPSRLRALRSNGRSASSTN
jgi:hypothetical protein